MSGRKILAEFVVKVLVFFVIFTTLRSLLDWVVDTYGLEQLVVLCVAFAVSVWFAKDIKLSSS